MPPLMLQGQSLGQRHAALNKVVNQAVSDKTAFEDVEKSPAVSDADNLFKIDVAAKYKQVPFILQTIQSEDMLYVSRAIKKSPWLITDSQYVDIINPQYLSQELFPHMTSKAISKLMLHIRLHLKNEPRVEQFYKYFVDKEDKDTALKWLPNCSQEFIEKVVEKEIDKISVDLFKRLCEKSTKVMKIVIDRNCKCYLGSDYMQEALKFINTQTEEFMYAFEKVYSYHRPSLSAKATAILLKKYPERVFNKIDVYIQQIDMPTMAKHVGKDGLKEFIIKLSMNKDLEGWFSYKAIEPVIKQLPKEGKFDFLKQVFIDKTYKEQESGSVFMEQSLNLDSGRCKVLQSSSRNVVSSKNVYDWYRHAPFLTAFNDIKNLIRTESSPDERVEMLKVLMVSAGSNLDHVYRLLEYFHNRHINEPTKFKLKFINSLLSHTETHRYNEKCWKMLDELFHNLEVYTESNNDVENCLQAVVAYKIVHSEEIPSIVEKNFSVTTFKKLINKLNTDEKAKIFGYVYKMVQTKIEKVSISSKTEFEEVLFLLNQILDLLDDWKKDIAEYPYVLNKIRDLIQLKENQNWDVDLKDIYNKNKSWKRHLFLESLLIVQNKDVYINMLKHQPELILKHQKQIDQLIKADTVDLTRVLSKLRVYFSTDLADQWLAMYKSKLHTCRVEQCGYAAVTRGLCVLLGPEQFAEILRPFVPKTFKVKWSEEDPAMLNLRKNFALHMFLVRPMPALETILQFAKGDYLQYAMPSLSSVCHRKSSEQCKKCLPSLLEGAVSLQKHGIRIAFAKLEPSELTDIFLKIWNSTKNVSIRAVTFSLAFKLLCKEKNPSKVQELWKLLSLFMENLSEEENKTIYELLGKVTSVPIAVRAQFCMKSYKILKSLPAKANCESLVENVASTSGSLMDTIDEDFVANILLEYIDELYVKKRLLSKDCSYSIKVTMMTVLSQYVLSAKSEEVQQRRYNNVLKIFLQHSLDLWKEVLNGNFVVKDQLNSMINMFLNVTNDNFINQKYHNPVKVFTQIKKALEVALPATENYQLFTRLSLITKYCECYGEVEKELNESKISVDDDSEERWNRNEHDEKKSQFWVKIGPLFGERCLTLMTEDVKKYFPSILTLFTKAFNDFCPQMHHNGLIEMVNVMVADASNVYAVLFGIDILSDWMYDDKNKEKLSMVIKNIIKNPSSEVKMFFYSKFGENCNIMQLIE